MLSEFELSKLKRAVINIAQKLSIVDKNEAKLNRRRAQTLKAQKKFVAKQKRIDEAFALAIAAAAIKVLSKAAEKEKL